MQDKELVRFANSPVTDAAALGMMRLSLFDWSACGWAGKGEPVAEITRSMVTAEGGQEQATLIGGGRVPARGAALVNGTISHALDYDDTHFAHIGHPSVAVIPAALAVAETEGQSLDACVSACLIGVEASIRVGMWLGRAHYQAGFHQTATAGAFGATLAAGRLMGLTEEQLAHALGIASTRAAGLKSQFGTMGKPLNAGIAASTGVEAASLARAGFISNPDGLTGGQGFGQTHHGTAEDDALIGLGEDWQILTISHKFHACCHGLHATLEALSQVPVDPNDVKTVEITTHPRWLKVCNIARPTTGLEAKFSYAFTAAMALSGVDTSAMTSFSDETAQVPALCTLRDRVRVVVDDTLPETAARVRIEADAVYTAQHDLAAPMSLETRTDKLRAKARALVGERREVALWQACQATDLKGLVACLSVAHHG